MSVGKAATSLKCHPIPDPPASPSSHLIPFLAISPPWNSHAKSLPSWSSLAASVATGISLPGSGLTERGDQGLERTWALEERTHQKEGLGQGPERTGQSEGRGWLSREPGKGEGEQETFGWALQSLSWALGICSSSWVSLWAREGEPGGWGWGSKQ